MTSTMMHFKNNKTPTYELRFDYDGWMVIDASVLDGELVHEPLRRDLSFGEAERWAAFVNRRERRTRHPPAPGAHLSRGDRPFPPGVPAGVPT